MKKNYFLSGAPGMLTSNSQEKKYKLNGVSLDKSVLSYSVVLTIGLLNRFVMESEVSLTASSHQKTIQMWQRSFG